MKQIPVGKETEKNHLPLVIPACEGSNNMAHLSIAIGDAFGYCVCWKMEVLSCVR